MSCDGFLRWLFGERLAAFAEKSSVRPIVTGSSAAARCGADAEIQASALPTSADGGILLGIPLDLLLLRVLPRLALADIVAISSTCLLLRAEVDACAGLWSGLRRGCATRAEFQRAYLASCATCSAPEAREHTFEHSPGLCAHCASRMPSLALREFISHRRLRDFRIGAGQRARVRVVLREVLRLAAERTRRPELAALAGRPLTLGFASHRDGHSLNLLLHALHRHAPTLLLVREQPKDEGPARSFGVFIPVQVLRRTAPDTKSDQGRGAFFFSLPVAPRPRMHRSRGADGRPAAEPPRAAHAARVWPGATPDGGEPCVAHFYATSADLLAFGGDARAYGLQLATDLQSGVSLPCPSFCSPTLSSEPAFRVRSVEAWRVVGAEEEEHEWQSAQAQGRPVRSLDEEEEPAAEGAEGAGSVLEPGSDRLMLEFVNMREDLLLARRTQ